MNRACFLKYEDMMRVFREECGPQILLGGLRLRSLRRLGSLSGGNLRDDEGGERQRNGGRGEF